MLLENPQLEGMLVLDLIMLLPSTTTTVLSGVVDSIVDVPEVQKIFEDQESKRIKKYQEDDNYRDAFALVQLKRVQRGLHRLADQLGESTLPPAQEAALRYLVRIADSAFSARERTTANPA